MLMPRASGSVFKLCKSNINAKPVINNLSASQQEGYVKGVEGDGGRGRGEEKERERERSDEARRAKCEEEETNFVQRARGGRGRGREKERNIEARWKEVILYLPWGLQPSPSRTR